MQAFIIDTCKEDLKSRYITKQDVEGFLSSFVYNRYGGTDIKKVAPLIWEQNPQELNNLSKVHVRAVPPPHVVNGEFAETMKSAADQDSGVTDRRMRDLLVEIEDKSFESKPKKFEAFKAMDKDGDGFISYKDFQQHLAKHKVQASEQEITTLMTKVLDPEQKGYIDFKTFQNRFGPLMSKQVAVDDKELHL